MPLHNFKAGRVTAPPQMPIAEVAALVDAARNHGRQTFAHASGTDGIEHVSNGDALGAFKMFPSVNVGYA